MPDGLSLAYLALVGLVAAASFWDAPLALVRAHREGRVTQRRRYHAVNAVAVAALVLWLVLLLGIDLDAPVAGDPLPLWARLAGAAVGWTGLSAALWARLALGRAFAPTAAVPHDRRVVTGGPYALVRHPFYVGMMLALAGGVLALDSVVTLGLMALMAPLVRELAVLEEEHLARVLGGSYPAYAEDVPRFVPGARPGAVGRA